MYKNKQRGFTLLELLVTLVIVGILITFVAVSFTTNTHKHEIRVEATQLARKIELIRRVATTHNETWGVRISRDSYQFLKFDQDEKLWRESSDRRYRSHDLPVNMFLQFDGNQDIPMLTDKLDELEPEMMVVPGGEMTPFILYCKHEFSEHVRVLESDGLNHVEVFTSDEFTNREPDDE